jgi:hypothetical protein
MAVGEAQNGGSRSKAQPPKRRISTLEHGRKLTQGELMRNVSLIDVVGKNFLVEVESTGAFKRTIDLR